MRKDETFVVRVTACGCPRWPGAPCSWLCLVEHSPAPPCSPVLGVFGVVFGRVLVGEGEGEAVELPFLPREGLLVLGRGRRRPPWRKGGMPTASWDLRR